jgi:ABC-type cobalamin/Fe3+-siderophores transport system ATPase subunit
LVMRSGAVFHCGATRRVFTDQILKELYGLPLRLIRKKGRYWPVLG